jgi:hypothetical protein
MATPDPPEAARRIIPFASTFVLPSMCRILSVAVFAAPIHARVGTPRLGNMTVPQLYAGTVPLERHAWLVGGILLIASAVVGVAVQDGVLLLAGGILSALLFSAALLVFAFGMRGAGSVTARRPLGTAALTVLAAWVLAVPTLSGLILSADVPLPALLGFAYVDSLVQFAAALVAVVQIARARVVPSPWRWAPAWVLGVVVAIWMVEQIVSIGLSGEVPPAAMALMAFEGLVHLGGPVFLGVVAITLANRTPHPQTVPVYRTSD